MTAIQNKFLQFLIIIFSLLFFISNSEVAFANNSKEAEEFISNISRRVLKIINSKALDDKKTKKLEEIFNDVVDMNWMSKFAIAKFWKNMSDDQKSQYLASYKKYLIKTYVPKFKEYNNQAVKIIGSKDLGNDQYQVMTQILATKGTEKTTINISYRCKKDKGSFKIRNITSEDFSLLSTQRSEFAAVIEKGGIDNLIKTLEKK